MQGGGRDTIAQRIALIGDDDLKRQLQEIGELGEKAFTDLKAAAEAAGSVFNQLSGGVEDVQSIFRGLSAAFSPMASGISTMAGGVKQFGSELTNIANNIFPHFREVLSLGIAGAVAGLVVLAKSSISNIKELTEMSLRLGITTQTLQAFGQEARDAGLEQEKLGAALGRFERNVATAYRDLRTNAQELIKLIFSGMQEGGSAVLRGGQQAVMQMGIALKGMGKDGLEAVEDVSSQSGKIVGIVGGEIKNFAAIARSTWIEMTKDQQSFFGTFENFFMQLRATVSGTEKAAVDIGNVLAKMGVQIPSADMLVELTRAGEKLKNGFLELGVVITDSEGKLRPIEDILMDYMDAFSKLPNEVKRAERAMADFGGREIAGRMIPILMKGSSAVKELRAEMERSGLLYSDQEKAEAEQLEQTMLRLRNSIEVTKNRIGLAIGEAFLPFMEQLNEWIKYYMVDIQAFLESVLAEVVYAIREFIQLMNGSEANVSNEWLKPIVSFIKGIPEALKTAGQWLQWFADIFNSIFGTDLTATSLAAILIIGQLTGAFGLIAPAITIAVGAIQTLIGLGIALGLAFGPWGVIIGGIVLAVAALGVVVYRNWGTIKEYTKSAIAYLDGVWQSAKKLFYDWIGKPFADIAKATWDAFVYVFGGLAEWLKSWIVDPIVNATKSVIGFFDDIIKKAREFLGLKKEVEQPVPAQAAPAAAVTTEDEAIKNVRSELKSLTGDIQPTLDWTQFKDDASEAIDYVKLELEDTLSIDLNFSQVWEGFSSAATDAIDGARLDIEQLPNNIDWSVAWRGFDIAAKEAIDGIQPQIEGLMATQVEPAAGGEAAGPSWTIWLLFLGEARSAIDEVKGLIVSLVAGDFDWNAFWQIFFNTASSMIDQVVALLKALGSTDIDWTLWQGFKQIADRTIAAVAQELADLAAGASMGFGGGGGAPEGEGYAGGGLVRGSGTGDRVPARLEPGEYVLRGASVRHYGTLLLDAMNSLRAPIREAVRTIIVPSVAMRTTVPEILAVSRNTFRREVENVQNSFRPILKFATGGSVRDTIHALLEPGEFVVKSAAVRHYGVLALEAINSMRAPLIEGLQSMAVPALPVQHAFAEGGRVSAGGRASAASSRQNIFNIHIGTEVWEGLTAPDATAERMVRYARRRKILSAGDKP